MKIIRKSQFTGNTHDMDIDCSIEQLKEFESGSGRLIKDIFPSLTSDEREFILTGATPDEWDMIFYEYIPVEFQQEEE